MAIRNADHAAQYGVLIHSMEVVGPREQWTAPMEPIPGTKISRTDSGWVKQPWRCVLQAGGLRECKVAFGPSKAQEFRNFLNSTPAQMHWSSDFKNDSTGLTHGGLSRLFTINKIDGKAGIPEAYKDKKYSELLEFDDTDYTVTWTQDWSLGGDGVKERIKSLGLLDSNNFFHNPMPGIIPSMPLRNRWNADDQATNWGRSNPSNIFCCTFWPQHLTTYDQLYRSWGQCGYIKFTGEELEIPKRGTKDIIFVSSAVTKMDKDFEIGPGRPYELKSDRVTLTAPNSAIIIHLYQK